MSDYETVNIDAFVNAHGRRIGRPHAWKCRVGHRADLAGGVAPSPGSSTCPTSGKAKCIFTVKSRHPVEKRGPGIL